MNKRIEYSDIVDEDKLNDIKRRLTEICQNLEEIKEKYGVSADDLFRELSNALFKKIYKE